MSENEQLLKGIDDPEYPIFEMHTDENGNPSVRISDKVAVLTQEQSKQVLERFKSLEDENTKLRELVVSYDSALHRICDQMQGHVDCRDCRLGVNYGDDSCAIDELRKAAYAMKVELDD